MSGEKPNAYRAEFRASAVKSANEFDKPISQVAKDLGINVNICRSSTTKSSLTLLSCLPGKGLAHQLH